MKTPTQIADFIMNLYAHFGNQDYIGEPVSQLEHMCQCALLAEREGYGENVVLAAFLHDIGHLCEHVTEVKYMDQYGVADHERIGAEFLLENNFSADIASLVRNHVEAKRYLTYKDATYFHNLSEASKKTLSFQGGRMSPEEAEKFELDPLFTLHIKLRRWDELAKAEGQSLPELEKFRKMIIAHLEKKITYDEAGSI